MDNLLIFVIVLLSLAICALGAFWFYRAAHAQKPKTAQYRRGGGNDPWAHSVRPSRNKV